jgi:hypothetical protein
MIPKPQDPFVLATAAVSSIVIAHDTVVQGAAPNYWLWSSSAYQAVADALLGAPVGELRELAAHIAANPRDDLACRQLATAIGVVLASASPPAWATQLVQLVQDVECHSRLLMHFGDGRDLREDAGPPPSEHALISAISQPPHHGTHPVDVAIVIPFRAPSHAAERARNIAAVLNGIAHQSYPRDRYRVVVVESDEQPRWKSLLEGACDRYVFAPCAGPFNKSWTVNAGVVHGALEAEIICILDGDILVDHDFIERAVVRFQEGGTQAYWPYRDLLYLDERASARAGHRRCLEAAPRVEPEDLRGVYVRRTPGACVWVRQSLFRRIGGMDERFVGWGGEDEDFAFRVLRYAPFDRYDEPLVHLHHGRGPQKPGSAAPVQPEREKFSVCSWPADSEIGRLDRYVP